MSCTNLLGVSQSSLCGNLNKLVMRSKRGRPIRKSKKWQNPFDFKLSSRLVNKHVRTKGRAKRFDNASRLNARDADDKMRNDSSGVVPNVTKEAESIIDTALQMGLEVVGGSEEGIRVLSKKLEDGEI